MKVIWSILSVVFLFCSLIRGFIDEKDYLLHFICGLLFLILAKGEK
jgi:uncharacterized membrane protein required for colicin V production